MALLRGELHPIHCQSVAEMHERFLDLENPFDRFSEPPISCSICTNKSTTVEHGEVIDRLQACQERLWRHETHAPLSSAQQVADEAQRYVKLSEEMTTEIDRIIESNRARLPLVSKHGEAVLYHDERLTFHYQYLGPTDCLGRSQAHRWLDHLQFSTGESEHLRDKKIFSLISQYDLNAVDILGRTLLHIACRKQWKNGIRWMLERGARTDVETEYKSLPLHYAAAQGSWDICVLLVDHGSLSVVRKQDYKGRNARFYAAAGHHRAVVEYLDWIDAALNASSLDVECDGAPYCRWDGCGHAGFPGTFWKLYHMSNSHLRADSKQLECRWSPCSRSFGGFESTHTLKLHVHTAHLGLSTNETLDWLYENDRALYRSAAYRPV